MEELLNQLSPKQKERLDFYLRPEMVNYTDKLLESIVNLSNENKLDIIDTYRIAAYSAMRIVNSIYFIDMPKEEVEKITNETSALANDLLGKLFTDILGSDTQVKTEQMLLLPLFMMDNLAFNLFTQTLMEEDQNK